MVFLKYDKNRMCQYDVSRTLCKATMDSVIEASTKGFAASLVCAGPKPDRIDEPHQDTTLPAG